MFLGRFLHLRFDFAGRVEDFALRRGFDLRHPLKVDEVDFRTLQEIERERAWRCSLRRLALLGAWELTGIAGKDPKCNFGERPKIAVQLDEIRGK